MKGLAALRESLTGPVDGANLSHLTVCQVAGHKQRTRDRRSKSGCAKTEQNLAIYLCGALQLKRELTKTVGKNESKIRSKKR